ncbi:MAG: phosphotransferase [Planctomycetes bacterium]|nr:phosphotransferase [Planctomycetota bacterium]
MMRFFAKKEIAQQLKRQLLVHGHTYFGESQPPQSVAIEPNCTAMIGTLAFGGGEKKLVIKGLPTHAHVSNAQELFNIHEGIRARNKRLAANTPRFVGFDEAQNLVFMEFVSGSTLDLVALQSLGSRTSAQDIPAKFRLAGEVLGTMHQLKADECGFKATIRQNRSFLDGFENAWKKQSLSAYLTTEFSDPRHLYEQLSDSFFDRQGESLLPVDSRPKNILVRDSGDLCFIDIDYSCGNPAMGLGLFLAAIDRLGLRSMRNHSAQISRWKQDLVSGYFQQMPQSALEDLIFFYPWALLAMLQQHAVARPWLAWYLRKHYARPLREFLDNIRRLSRSEIFACPGKLFACPY